MSWKKHSVSWMQGVSCATTADVCACVFVRARVRFCLFDLFALILFICFLLLSAAFCCFFFCCLLLLFFFLDDDLLLVLFVFAMLLLLLTFVRFVCVCARVGPSQSISRRSLEVGCVGCGWHGQHALACWGVERRSLEVGCVGCGWHGRHG